MRAYPPSEPPSFKLYHLFWTLVTSGNICILPADKCIIYMREFYDRPPRDRNLRMIFSLIVFFFISAIITECVLIKRSLEKKSIQFTIISIIDHMLIVYGEIVLGLFI